MMLFALLPLFGFSHCSEAEKVSADGDCALDTTSIEANAAQLLKQDYVYQNVTRFDETGSSADRLLDAQASIDVYDCRNEEMLSIVRQYTFGSDKEAQSSKARELSLISKLASERLNSLLDVKRQALSEGFAARIRPNGDNHLMNCACSLFQSEMQGATQ